MNTQHNPTSLEQRYECFLQAVNSRTTSPLVIEDHGHEFDRAVVEIQSRLQQWIVWHLEGARYEATQIENLMAESFERFLSHCLFSERAPCCEGLLHQIAGDVVAEFSSRQPDANNAAGNDPASLQRHCEFFVAAVKNGEFISRSEYDWQDFDQAVLALRTYILVAIRWRLVGVTHTPEEFEQMATISLGRFIEFCRVSSEPKPCGVLLDQIVEQVVSEFRSKAPNPAEEGSQETTLQEDYESVIATIKRSDPAFTWCKSHQRCFNQAILTIQSNLQFAVNWHLAATGHDARESRHLMPAALTFFVTHCIFSESVPDCRVLLDQIGERAVVEFVSANRPATTTLQKDYDYILAVIRGREIITAEVHWLRFDQAMLAIRCRLLFALRWHMAEFPEISGDFESLVTLALRRFVETARISDAARCESLLDQIAEQIVKERASLSKRTMAATGVADNRSRFCPEEKPDEVGRENVENPTNLIEPVNV